MEKIKDNLVGTLGIVGYVIWIFILFGIYFIPVIVLNLPLWVEILIVLCIMNIPVIGNLLYFASWVWSFTIVISEPIDGWSIFYFVAFGIYILTEVLPFIINLIIALFDKSE